MTNPTEQGSGPTRQQARGRDAGRVKSLAPHLLACAFMTIAALGLVVAVLLGAPLVSILLVGLLLVCPLLMWVPFRFQERGERELRSGSKGVPH